ncbi:uncharacterized protein LOC113665757, partial [Pocillopora damicornis]|uniref:uncharacterized protein LOC113665757 n=1 Tax=Pocillopora damicornis TaxID=46731 RepID=UPI000F54CCD6
MESVAAGFPLWRCYGDYVEVLDVYGSDRKFCVCPRYGEALAASISDKKTLTSPGYPLLPPASLFSWWCRWILKVPDDLSTGGAYVLKVTFNHFNLQKSYDRLTFYDGIDSSYKRLGKSYTGTVHPDVIYST